MSSQVGFQYVVLRCVPRVDREEFLNLGVLLYAQDRDFLDVAYELRSDCLQALAPTLDLGAVNSSLQAVAAVCAGSESAGAAGRGPLGVRFGFLAAPRSTVVQPGPIHGGLTADPARQLEHLLASLVE